ncbi:MAG: sulfite exporter TauE/SafE family protein [Verrucomicrobiales bacterium]|nr:sulfite exporter TauE/SafE family protein [Verrucomicrobiales bacterium]
MTIQRPPKLRLWIWLLWLGLFYGVWLWLVVAGNLWDLTKEHWPMAAAMAAGSYAAGSTPMGGGTVGFPILVLLFNQPAELGRDFSFAVQAIGMTSASIFILARRQPLAFAMLKGAIAGVSLGVPIGIFLIAPYIPALWIKLTFAVVWGSFGLLHLWRIGEISSHDGMTEFDEHWDIRVGIVAGFLAGATVVAVSGVGVDMVLYTVLVLVCRADLKIAIPSSVIIMAYASVIGILTKLLFTGVQPGVFGNWMAAAPVVALGAPLGVFVVTLIGRKPTLIVVAVLCVAQLIWTLTREKEALGTSGVLYALIAVGLCLFGFEKLRAYGAFLVGEIHRKRRGSDLSTHV